MQEKTLFPALPARIFGSIQAAIFLKKNARTNRLIQACRVKYYFVLLKVYNITLITGENGRGRIVTRLDDLLEPLSQGVWEVVIPREAVDESLDTGWVRSHINVPSPGTIASFRKGRFHAHETRTEWRVHLDRYDPKTNPLMHLIDDAPLVLMISDTFMTLIMDTRRRERESTKESLKNQRFIWQEQIFYGILLILVGLFILNNPVQVFNRIFDLILPLAIMGVAFLFFARTFRAGLPRKYMLREFLSGIIIFGAGILAFLLPMDYWITGSLAVLAIWMIGSAGILLFRVAKGKKAVPEGFYSRLAVGLISLAIVILLLIFPKGVLVIEIEILGAVTILLGITLCTNGVRLRSWIREAPATADR
jgi:uncharacterized membrane protein HdeD (DUF308 family)